MKIWKFDIRWARIRKSIIIRIIGTMFMLSYVYMGANALVVWGAIQWNKNRDASYISTVIDEAAAKNDIGAVSAWIRYRPLTDTDELIAAITPKSAVVGPDVFFELMRRELQRGHTEEAVFWLNLGQYRLRYDILRCGGGTSAKDISNLLAHMTPEKIENIIKEKPELVTTSIRRVLDFDAKYPAESNPYHVCEALNKITRLNYVPLPREDWTNIRNNLRQAAENHLSQEGAQ